MKHFTKRRLIELLIGSAIILAGAVYFIGLDRIHQRWINLTGGRPTKIDLGVVDLGFGDHSPSGPLDLSAPNNLMRAIELYNHLVDVGPVRQTCRDPSTVMAIAPDLVIVLSKSNSAIHRHSLVVFEVDGVSPTVRIDNRITFRASADDKKHILAFLRHIDPKGSDAGHYP